ncbi:MAG: Fur family transcriptional regulator [Pseudomonadota bacterium]
MSVPEPGFPPSKHDHAACVASAIEHAESVCQQAGKRLTAQRRWVLELVWASHKPVGAYDILEAMSAGGKRYAPPTVYRALDFLIDAGLVHRLDSLNAYVGCRDPSHAHSAQFLICTGCHAVLELDDPGIEASIRDRTEHIGFKARSVGLEVQGLCRACSET